MLRHDRGARLIRLGAAILIMALVVSGFGLAGLIPDPMTSLLGGHLVFDTTHTLVGLVFSAAFAFLPPLMPARARGLVRDVGKFDRTDTRWPLAFLRFSLHPRRPWPPHHEGRFDPAQRVIFLGLGISLVLLSGQRPRPLPDPAKHTGAARLGGAHTYFCHRYVARICGHPHSGRKWTPADPSRHRPRHV